MMTHSATINAICRMAAVAALSLSMLSCGRGSGNSGGDFPDMEMRHLDKAIAGATAHSERASAITDSLKAGLRHPDTGVRERVETMIAISKRYRQSMADSALAYSSMAAGEAPGLDARSRFRADLALADALGASGFFSQAIFRYDSLDPSGRDTADRIEYHKVGRRIYSNLCSYMEGHGVFHDEYLEKYAVCDDSLVNLLPASDPLRSFIVCERLIAKGKFAEAAPGLEHLLSSLDKGDNIYGMAAYQLASVHKNRGENAAYAACLAKAAESDIIGSVREGYALPALAAWLYQHGDFARAFRYINFALEDAYRGNARVRMVSMAPLVTAIDEAYRREISASRNELILSVVFTSLLIIALATLAYFLVREIRKSRASQKALSATSRMKDFYIGNFIGLCSTYSEKYYSLLRLVDRKISSGQASELLKAVKSGKIAESEDEDFYKQIDSVVLSLYPDFVDKINSLLQPDRQITISNGQLTPELRIYAFVKLGVSESTRIARILNYSVNTVYAYRNRMRNRAIDRDRFDENVLKIGSHDPEMP